MKAINGKDKVFLGVDRKTAEFIYITKPTWDCEWYWSFGYLGNVHCHYHLDDYQKGRNINMYDALLTDYDLVDRIRENLWTFCELALTIYTLKETAEVLRRGGSHCSTNPCKMDILDVEYTNKLNNVVLPKVMQTFWDLVEGKNVLTT